MSLFAQYFNERRRRLAKLPLGRWWLSEYLGRVLIAVGLGLLVAGVVPESFRVGSGVGIILAGVLVTGFCYGWKQSPIDVCLEEEHDKMSSKGG